MLVRLIGFLISVSPLARRLLWRWWYEKLAREAPMAEWTFMNYGFIPSDGRPPLALAPEDEPDRTCIQLYHHVASPGALRGKQVLEVGSGRGGGASYVARHLGPARMTGVDFSPQAVALCQRRHRVPNLEFQVGDAMRLPFADGSFDAVLNVESSHCYASIETFFREVARVLRPGGRFLYADLRDAKEMPELEAHLAAEPGLALVEREDITAQVSDALLADHARKQESIRAHCPPRQLALFEQFAGLSGSIVQQRIQSGAMRYHRFVLERR